MDVRLIKAMVIGDGCLDNSRREQGYRNARFTMTHGHAQKDYLLWKRDLLAAAGWKSWYSEFENTTNPHTGKRGLMCRIETPASPVLTVLREQMYPHSEGFKPGVLDDLDDLHLAIIFMDDGSKAVMKTVGNMTGGKRQVFQSDPYIAQFRLSMQAWGFTGCAQFRDWLRTKFGVESKVWKQAQQPVVVVNRLEDKKRFRDIIRPHLHASMTYKVEGSFNAHIVQRERLSERAPEEVRVMRQSELGGNEPREAAPKSPPAGPAPV